MQRAVTAAVILALALGTVAASAADEEEPATGAFSRTGSIAHAPFAPLVWEAAALPDGRVVVFSGGCHADSMPSVEVWDPETGEFEPIVRLAKGRCFYTATPLADGRVLVLGGARSNRGMSPQARVLDPATGSLKVAGKLEPPRIGHTATRLQDGRVLIVGGSSSDEWNRLLDSAILWDPETEEFSVTGSMAHARSGHTAALLPDGRVLVVGGAGGSDRGSAEIWDPVSGNWSPTGSPAHRAAAEDFMALALADGRVLVTGGYDYSSDPEGPYLDEVWDPATGEFTTIETTVWSDRESTVTVLPDGRIVVIGGEDEFGGADVWDPATWSSSPAGDLIRSRGQHVAAALPDGRVLVVGGGPASAEVWDPNGIPMPVSEEFERVGLPSVFGNRSEDGVIVLDDRGFCSYLLGGIWNQASVVPADLVLQQHDGDAIQEAVEANARYPATDEDLLARCAQTLNRSAAGAGDDGAPEWSVEHPVVPHALARLLEGDEATTGRRQRMEPSSREVLETEMMLGVRQDLQGTCVAKRSGLPDQVSAAIECEPNAHKIDKVRIYLFERQRDAMDAYFGRLAAAGWKRPKQHYPELEGASFVDRSGRAHYLIPSGSLLFEVIGTGRREAGPHRFAWLGNQSQPGGPTVCCDGGTPEK